MWELLTQKQFFVLLSVVALVVVMVIAYVTIVAVRRATSTSDTDSDNLASDFEEMQLEGDINEEELRSIRAVLEKTQAKR